jgi:glycerol-3-phosphate dehydrogenase
VSGSGGGAGLRRIAAEGPDIWAQAQYAKDEEWALCVDDVVRRRTTLELRGLATPEVRTSLADVLGLPQTVGPVPVPASA